MSDAAKLLFMAAPLDPILRSLIQKGNLTVIDPQGAAMLYGDGSGTPITIRIHDRATLWRLLFDPQLEAGDAYMDGRLTVEQGTLYDFLELLFRSLGLKSLSYPLRGVMESVRRLLRRVDQFNPVSRSHHNVAHHYDLSGMLYDQFLDEDRQYSCGYFRTDEDSLEVAQEQKKRHIAAKLLLRPGQRILDIGSGWGGLALFLAKGFEVDVTGLTLSKEQYALSSERIIKEALEDRVRFKMLDYRHEEGRYDRIVSVGMFEHVGVGHYDEFFKKMADLLTEDGVALLHAIGRPEGPGYTNPWIAKYIFPGGYSPALSEVLPAIERAGLLVTDIEILRFHYAETLRHWRARFQQNRETIRKLYDERFCRMWEFYLIGSELSFRHQGQMVFQIQLSKCPETLPITRDYMAECEEACACSRRSSSERISESSTIGMGG